MAHTADAGLSETPGSPAAGGGVGLGDDRRQPERRGRRQRPTTSRAGALAACRREQARDRHFARTAQVVSGYMWTPTVCSASALTTSGSCCRQRAGDRQFGPDQRVAADRRLEARRQLLVEAGGGRFFVGEAACRGRRSWAVRRGPARCRARSDSPLVAAARLRRPSAPPRRGCRSARSGQPSAARGCSRAGSAADSRSRR